MRHDSFTCANSVSAGSLKLDKPTLLVMGNEGRGLRTNVLRLCDILVQVKHDSFICVTTHSYVLRLIHMWHDSFIRGMTHSNVTWFIHTWHNSFIRDMTHSYVTWLLHTWHGSFIRDMTHSYVTWLIHTWHDSFVRDMITSKYIHTSVYTCVTYMNESCHTPVARRQQK